MNWVQRSYKSIHSSVDREMLYMSISLTHITSSLMKANHALITEQNTANNLNYQSNIITANIGKHRRENSKKNLAYKQQQQPKIMCLQLGRIIYKSEQWNCNEPDGK